MNSSTEIENLARQTLTVRDRSHGSPPGWAQSRLRFALVAAAWLLMVYNLRFWGESVAAVGGPAPRGLLFLGALAIILLVVHVWLLLLLPGRRLPVFVVGALLVAASILAYFESAYVVYFDSVMVRNVFETDAGGNTCTADPEAHCVRRAARRVARGVPRRASPCRAKPGGAG